MRFEIGILRQRPSAEAGAIDDESERGIDLFQCGQMAVQVDFAACLAETLPRDNRGKWSCPSAAHSA